jgi:uncharacterized protein (TIGR02594 family)
MQALIQTSDTPPHIATAASLIGERETALNDSKFIRSIWAKLNIPWLKNAPWCGGFVAYCLDVWGLPYQNSPYRALEWANYGSACVIPHLGCIAVLKRKGGGHVAFVIGYRIIAGESWLLLLGGNQSDSVSLTAVRSSNVECFRGLQKHGLPLYPASYFSKQISNFA